SISNFRTGDIVVLYKQEYPLTEQQLIRGTINLIENDKIVIRTRSIIRQEGVFDHYTLWAIEPDLIESSLYTGISSVYSLLCSDKSVRDKLMGFIQPEIEDIKFANVLSWRNDIAESLKGMIAAKDYYMVQGPPGTGKTSCLLIQYLTHLIHETSCKALVISFTNRAVDEICNYLENENISYLRLGSQQKITNNGKDKKKHQHLNKDALNLTILNYESERLFVSTVHSLLAVAPDFLRKINIDELIVDEASQILEHHIIGLVSKIKKTILVGDQNQLPPIILQQTKNEKESILEKFIVNADRNLFQNCYSMLTDHYRMHDDIARLVSYNYKNKLIPAEKRQTSKQPWLVTENKFLKNIMKSRLVWIDARPSLISKADTMHADWIKDFLDALSADIPIEEVVKKVGVIAPFRAQAQCIISKFGNKYKDLTVDTVERYQGSQRDCIIMSYPIRYQYELNLLQSVNMLGTIDRKLNVAISRAREQLIIIGNSRILAHSEFYHKVFNLIKENGLVISLKQ
ncbi:MAG: DNA2/NAM7 family helicase, partial [Candidatus Cloacimonetes bacterium]|nr:DNA2/NAM7 family helicase [Candidatus Cloacimonadota bacterium]